MEDTSTVQEYSGKWWVAEAQAAEKVLDDRWRTSADKVVDRYLDRRDDDQGDGGRKYNLFWANVQIIKSALYANPPKPHVRRQNGDAKDDVARTAALILERILAIGITKDLSDMHSAIRGAVEDRLIPGLGQVWLRYESVTEPFELQGPTGEPIKGERIVKEEAKTDYVHWRDFFWSPARCWEDVWWIGRRVWMKRSAFIKRWGEAKYKELKEAIGSDVGATKGIPKGFKKGRVEVLELWCEETNKVYWCSPHLDDCLEVREDPLLLDDFFPCPMPLLATHTTNDVTPRPDFVMMQDQYDELDDLNRRINVLTKALRVVGAYDKMIPELGQMLTGSEFNMIAVDSWAVLAEKGGLKGVVDWFPVDQIAKVLRELTEQRVAVVQQIYELSSISDIMRGASNPRETAKAQTLKAQYSSVRLQLIQGDVSAFVTHAMRLKAEIIAKHFQPETIKEMSQIEFTESAAFAEPAIQLVKNWDASRYRIEIDEESMSLADYNAEREMRIELATAFGQFLSQSAQMVGAMPSALPYLLRILQWVISAFRGSEDIEAVLDDAIKSAQQLPSTPMGQPQKPEKPDPTVVEAAKAEAQVAIDNNQQRNALQLVRAEGIRDILTQPDPSNDPPRAA